MQPCIQPARARDMTGAHGKPNAKDLTATGVSCVTIGYLTGIASLISPAAEAADSKPAQPRFKSGIGHAGGKPHQDQAGSWPFKSVKKPASFPVSLKARRLVLDQEVEVRILDRERTPSGGGKRLT